MVNEQGFALDGSIRIALEGWDLMLRYSQGAQWSNGHLE